MPCRLTLVLRDGRQLVVEKRDYEGFHTRPMGWDTVVDKFERLSAPYTTAPLRQKIVQAVADLETTPVRELMELLARVQLPARG
jgi:2-methylcitrate dehydratase